MLAGLAALHSVLCNLCFYLNNEYYIISKGVFVQISHAAVNNNNDNGSKRYYLSNCLNCVVVGCDNM